MRLICTTLVLIKISEKFKKLNKGRYITKQYTELAVKMAHATSAVVMLGSKRIHVAFMDSRGDGLQDLIDKMKGQRETLEIDFRKGATLGDLVEKAKSYLKDHPFDVIYIAGGANNITHKNKWTKQISYTWGPGEGLKKHLVDSLLKADRELQEAFPATKIIFCPMVGSELAKIVNAHEVTDLDQQVVEEAVWEFNNKVFTINARRGTFSPPLHHQVHRFCKGARKAYYQHLRDGLHPTVALRQKWAKNFIKAVAQN